MEDADCDGKVGCDCAATFDGSNKWIKCTYKVLLVRIETDSNIINEPINNVYATLSFIVVILDYYFYIIIKPFLNYDHIEYLYHRK